MSLRNLLIPVILVLVISMPAGSFLAMVHGQEGTNLQDLTRSEEVPSQESMFLIDGNSEFEYLDSISVTENDILRMEKNSISDHLTIPSSPQSYNGPRRNIFTYDEQTFFTYARMDQANQTVDFYFMVTNEKDGITEGPVSIGSLPYSNWGYIDIEIHDDLIFFLMSNTSADRSQSGIYLKMVNIDDWARTLEMPMSRLDQNGDISSKFKVLGTEIGAVVFWMEDLSGDIYSMVFDGSIWGNANAIRTDADNMFPIVSGITGSEQVNLIYTNPDGPEVNITASLNGGLSFGITIPVGITGKGSRGLAAINGDGRLHIAALNENSNLIYHFHSDNYLQWTSNGPITPYVEPSIGSRDELQISIERDNVLIAYEDDDMIRGIISFDGGENFNQIWNLSGNGYSTPMMDLEKEYIGFHDGDDWIIRKFTLPDVAWLTTEPFSPLGLRSWDSIGFNVAGAGSGTSIGFRLVDENRNNLYPVNGFIDIDPFQGGTIHGHQVKHLITLEDQWTVPDELEETVRVDIRIFRGASDDPVITDIILDMTVGYPVRMDLTSPLHLVSMENLTFTSKGLELDEFSPKGTFIIGPIWKEGGWPDILSVKLGAFSNKIGFNGEILDRYHVPLESFTMDDSDTINTIGEESQITWDGKHFINIPTSFDQVYLRFQLSKIEPTADPYIEYIDLEYSGPPYLVSYVEPFGPVYRGESLKFSLNIADAEDEQRDLDLMIESKPSFLESWGDENYIEGVLWNSSNWNVFFSPPLTASVGSYDLRYWIEDLTGNITGPVELPFDIEVLNIRPLPPVTHIEPAEVLTGDDVFVVMDQLGSDKENGTDLTYEYKVRLNDDLDMEGSVSGQKGLPLITIPGSKITRDDIWNIEIRSYDGIISSIPSTLEFTVANSAPRTTDPPDSLTTEEDVPLMIQPSDWFEDIDGDTLTYEIETEEGITVTSSEGSFSLEPWGNWNGYSNMTVTATDDELEASCRIGIEVLPVNDAPIFNVPSNITVYQGEDFHITICCRDDVDMDVTSVTSNIFEVIPRAIEGEDVLVYPNGSLWIRASNEMIGVFEIIFTGSDGILNFTKTLQLTILNVNSAPLKPVIEMDDDNRLWVGPTEVHLKGSCFDEDVQWGDSLTFSWSSSIQGNLGTGENLTVVLDPGVHIITLNVTDSEGISSMSTFEITITEKIKEEKDVMRTFILLIIMILIGLILGILIGFLIFKRVTKEKTEEEGEKKEDDKKAEEKGEEKGEENKKDEKIDPKEEVQKKEDKTPTPPAGGDSP